MTTPRMETTLHDDDAVLNPSTVRYRECQRNYAAHLAKHILDGCGEFMPKGKQGTPESMSCAACDCHRNFHRKEINNPHASLLYPLAPLHHHRPPAGTMMGFGGGASGIHAESSSGQDLYGGGGGGGGSRMKRFRTKFTEEQKEMMREFGGKIGWRIRKQDEDQVEEFCLEAGVKRHVFKVWMHNNGQTLKRKLS